MSNNTKLFAIGVLAVTAVILVCAVAMVDRLPVAHAESPDRGGDYIMVAGETTRGEQVVYVIDIGSQELGVYSANVSNNRIDPVAKYRLSRLPSKD